MADIVLEADEPPRGLQIKRIPEVFIRPSIAFQKILGQTRAIWFTPMLLLSLTGLARILASGSIGRLIAMSGEITLPPDFQFYTPEQQAQFMQAMQSTSGPVFVYILPAIGILLSIWLGWLLVGGSLHLVVTLLGGRGDTGSSMNLVAWAALPFALRDLIRAIVILISGQLINHPGLSGFVKPESSNAAAFAAAFLGLIDVYLIWHIILLILGVQSGNSLSSSKAVLGVLVTIMLALALQTVLGFLPTLFGGANIVRPFFF